MAGACALASDADGERVMAAPSTDVYHEQQSRMRCGQHAINNLLQQPVATAEGLNAIALDIGGDFSLEHRWPILGNWDANVMMLALQQCSPPLTADFWDARCSSEADLIELVDERCRDPDVLGLIVNVQMASWWTLRLFKGRHWYAHRKLDSPDAWNVHESHEPAPRALADGGVREMLRHDLCSRGGQILIVRRAGAE